MGNLTVGALAIHPQRPATIYAGVNANGVFKSTDAGASWSTSNTGVDASVSTLAIDPQSPANVYAASGGVFKSTDGGLSWSPSSAGLGDSPLVTALAIDPRTPTILYAGVLFSGGVFKSTDAGASWNLAAELGSSIDALAIDPQTPTIVYAGTDALGVFKSINGGATWDMGIGITDASALAIDPRRPATVYAGSRGGVFKSTDAGGSWTINSAGSINFAVSALVVNPAGSCLHAGSFGGIFSFGTRLDAECLPPPPLVSAVLPMSRSVEVGTGATAFVSITNAGLFDVEPSAIASARLGVEGVTCGITQLTGAPTPFTFQATDPATNVPIGTPNTPVNIAGGTTQTFVISLTPTAEFSPTEIQFGFNCTNTDLAPITVGVNTLLLSASATPVPDIVALAATLDNDGIVKIPGSTGTGAFSVATTNAGAGGVVGHGRRDAADGPRPVSDESRDGAVRLGAGTDGDS